MKYRLLGRTGIEVPIIGLGTAFLGRALDQADNLSAGQFRVDPELGIAAVQAAVRAGITLIDTAPFYGSEPIIGAALEGIPDLAPKVAVMTKAGRQGVGQFDFSRDAVRADVFRSLGKLGLDHLDVVSIHDAVHAPVTEMMGPGMAFQALRELRDEKVITGIGTACYDPRLNAEYIETGAFDVAIVSASWSMINQTMAQRILPAAVKHNTGLAIAEPLERGLLAVGPIPGRKYADRNFSQAVLDHVGKIQALCTEFGLPLLDVGLQWLTRHPQVSTAIPGAATPAEAEANAAAGSRDIPEEFWAALEPLIVPWTHADLGIEIK
jgi:D-threo-aldose 1-dehydrogenase